MTKIEESKKIIEALRKPFHPDEIEWRVQSASQNQNGTNLLILPYITSRTIMNRLDNVLGGFWQSNFDKIEGANPVAYQCRLSVKIDGEWITRTDAAEASDIESVKGGHSNALKRAGVQWGIGRYLYDLPPFWMPLENSGKHRVYGNFKIKGKQTKLQGYFDTPKLPSWALPESNVNTNVQNNQQASQPNPPQNQQTNTVAKERPSKQDDYERSMSLVIGLLEELKIPQNHVAPLLRKANGKIINGLAAASVEELGVLYHTLLPVCIYVRHCDSFGLDEHKMLEYAQITLKQPLTDIHNLLLKMNKEICESTLELVKGDLAINQVG